MLTDYMRELSKYFQKFNLQISEHLPGDKSAVTLPHTGKKKKKKLATLGVSLPLSFLHFLFLNRSMTLERQTERAKEQITVKCLCFKDYLEYVGKQFRKWFMVYGLWKWFMLSSIYAFAFMLSKFFTQKTLQYTFLHMS